MDRQIGTEIQLNLDFDGYIKGLQPTHKILDNEEERQPINGNFVLCDMSQL